MSRTVLDELVVGNLALIADAAVEPGPGLIVITGETGTGKTLLLGALRLLRGEAAPKDLIGPFGDEVAVDGRFFIEGEEAVLGRRVGVAKSRAYRDGAMVPARALADATEGVVEIVGQHDHLVLLERAGARSLLDGALDEAGAASLERYRIAWGSLRDLEGRQQMLGGDRRSLEREHDMVRFQAREIEQAGFAPGDDDELETRARRLRNSESLGEHLAALAASLGEEGATANMAAGARQLEQAARADPSLLSLAGQLAEVASLLGELVSDVAAIAGGLERDPAALEQVERRLATLADLRRKYGDDLGAVLEFGRAAAARADELEALLADADRIGAEVDAARAAVAAAGSELTEARQRTAKRVEAAAAAHLRDMGFPNPVLRFRFEPSSPSAGGADAITIEFASDEAMPVGPAARIASGGELSRLVLALRLATGVSDAPVIAFDEIDAGVGGATALAVGAKLAALSEGRQVLCVTHLPQVAAFATTHLVVAREGARATVSAVEGEARLHELTRMLSGLPESDQGKAHAAELLALAGAGGGRRRA